MKVFVAGANGRAGVELVKALSKAGHQVNAGSRHLDNIPQADNVSIVTFDVHASVDQMAKIVGHVDAIYCVIGNLKDLLQTDAFGAVKLMRVAEQNGIKRFVLLSGGFVPEPQIDSLLDFQGNNAEADAKYPGIMGYSVAKFFAENYLVHDTDLDYTILNPIYIKQSPATGQIQIDQGTNGSISYADLGQTMADLLKYPNTIYKILKLTNGQTPIDQALQEI